MTKEQIGQFIRKKRIEKKLSQKQLGELAGVRYQCLLQVEKCTRNYGIETLIAILVPLGYIVLIWNSEMSEPINQTSLVPYEEVLKTEEKPVPYASPKKKFKFKGVPGAKTGDKNEKHF